MSKIDNRYGKLINLLVRRSFPELSRHKILVLITNKRYGARVLYLKWVSLVVISQKVKYNAKELNGGLAHELAHLVLFKKYGFVSSFFRSAGAIFFFNLNREIEREADILAIKKGYGKELYAIRKKNLSLADSKTRQLIKNYYLSPEEIKSYAKSIGKW